MGTTASVDSEPGARLARRADYRLRSGRKGAVVAMLCIAGAFLYGASAARATNAPTPITDCSQAALQAALNAGGFYRYQQGCTVTLTSQLTSSANTTISANGNDVEFEGCGSGCVGDGGFRDIEVKRGNLALIGITVADGAVSTDSTDPRWPFPTAGSPGSPGTDGTDNTGGAGGDAGNGGDGTDPNAGTAFALGGRAMGGCILIDEAGTLTLNGGFLTGCSATGGSGWNGGDGGSGGDGGDGGSGAPGAGTGGAGGIGGNGGNGANGQNGVGARGGAIYNAGTLIVSGTFFNVDQAIGGNGGDGGLSGQGGAGGDGGQGGEGVNAQPGSGGSGGTGGAGGAAGNGGVVSGTAGNGGDGADATGGAIYNQGGLSVQNAVFQFDSAIGGDGGSPGLIQPTGAPGGFGGSGGIGGAGDPPGSDGNNGPAGAGGNGGNGANAGSGGGGGFAFGSAIDFAPGSVGAAPGNSSFSGDTATAGQACRGLITAADCGTVGAMPGAGGTGNPNGSPGASSGTNGEVGTDGGAGEDVNGSGSGALTADVSVSLAPASIPANGRSTTVATVTVVDSLLGGPLAGQVVAVSSTDPNDRIGPVTDNGDGTYSATITSSQTAGMPTIQATDNSVPGSSGTAQLTQTPASTNVAVSLSPDTISANGRATSAVTITITDLDGNRLTGQTVNLTSSDMNQQVSSVAEVGDGEYTATIRASKTVGQATITAADVTSNDAGSGTAILTQAAPTVSVSLNPGKIPADGRTKTQVTVTVTDPNDDPEPGDQVSLSTTDAGQSIGAVTDNGNGSYSAMLTASRTSGTSTITASDGSSIPAATGTAQLTQTGANVTVSLSPAKISANGRATSLATITVTDPFGDGLPNQDVTVASSDPIDQIGPVTDAGGGTYLVRITASNIVGPATITATDNSVNPAVNGTATLTQAAPTVTVSLNPPSIAPDGRAQTTATITVSDPSGQPEPGDTLTVASTDPGQVIGAVVDHGDGSYTAVITASTQIGQSTITASDNSSVPPSTATATLTEAVPTHTLSVSRTGSGSGTVTSTPGGISCGAACSAQFAAGRNVTLIESPAAGSTFAGWGGGCSGNGTTCTVPMSSDRSVTATFNTVPTLRLTSAPRPTATGVTITMTCMAPAGQVCQTTEMITSTVTLSGTNPIAVASAHKPPNKHKHAVVVGSRTVTLTAGQTKMITVSLNPIGRRLLAKFAKLPVTLTVVLAQNGTTSTVAKRQLTIKPTKRKR